MSDDTETTLRDRMGIDGPIVVRPATDAELETAPHPDAPPIDAGAPSA